MEFHWLNESKVQKTGDRIEIVAPAKTDFFCGSIDECEEGILPESLCNAPYYYTEMEGDFVLRVKVSHDFWGYLRFRLGDGHEGRHLLGQVLL